MKKIFLPVGFAIISSFALSQDFTDVNKAMILKQPEAAKVALDKVVADPKVANKPETYFYTGAVYAGIFANPALRAKYPNSGFLADAALRKYIHADTSFSMTLKYPAGPQPFFDIYSTSFDEGSRTYKLKEYDSAALYFSMAEFYSEYLFKRKWTKAAPGAFDTASTAYAGYAYQNNKQLDSAAKYYQILANYKVTGPDYKEIYQFLVNYYSTKNDNADFKNALAAAKEYYPADMTLWNEYEMQDLNNNSSIDDIVAKYKQEDAAGKITTADQYIGYGESFAGLTKDQLSKIDSAKQVDIKYLAADAYKKAFAMQQNGLYAFNAGIMYYNIYSVYDERFFQLRGETAGLKEQRTIVEKQEMPLADSAAYWLTQAYNILKAKTDRTKVESNSLNRTVDFLANIYSWKRDKSRGVNPGDVDKYDALFKQFDAEHDKYKP